MFSVGFGLELAITAIRQGIYVKIKRPKLIGGFLTLGLRCCWQCELASQMLNSIASTVTVAQLPQKLLRLLLTSFPVPQEILSALESNPGQICA